MPHLEFSSPAWSPWSIRDVEMLEAVQKKAVGIVEMTFQFAAILSPIHDRKNEYFLKKCKSLQFFS
jgi:hypothetical protein